MSSDPTLMCEIVVGLGDVNVLDVDDAVERITQAAPALGR